MRTRLPRTDALTRPPRVRRFRSTVGHVTGLVLVIGAGGMVASAIVEAVAGGRQVWTLAASAAIVAVPGFAWWRLTEPDDHIPVASIYAAVLSSWLALSLAGTLPYLAAGVFDGFADAFFESVSGFTTTGATVLNPIEGTAPGLLFWRSLTQWMGGIGIVVFAVSVLPVLGVGGMDLMAAEAPGPSSERLAPRVAETAKRLMLLYLGFTATVATLYASFGMSPFDAVTHALTTVSTGGFSPRNASFAHFGSASLEWIAIAGMVLAATSFVLIWRLFRGKPLALVRSTEFAAFLGIVGLASAAAVFWNVLEQGYSHEVVRHSVFAVVSISTTTGYAVADYDQWHVGIHLLLVFAMGLGGMAGSTAGGFKVFRLLAVLSYGRRQLFQALHPRAVTVIRFGRDVIPEAVTARVVGFFALFMAVGGVATFLVSVFGTDMRTAISAGASAIGNVGPGLGEIGPANDYLGLHVGARTILVFVMLLGRLEIFPVILGLVPLLRYMSDRLPPRLSQIFVRFGRG